MSDLNDWYAARDLMVEALEEDLIGLADGAVLTELPLDRFIVGVLHPAGDASPLEDTAETGEEETGTGPDTVADPGVNLSRRRKPSSMGLTFSLDPKTPSFVIEIEADRYHPVAADGDARREVSITIDRSSGGDNESTSWEPEHISSGPMPVDLAAGSTRSIEVTTGLEARVVMRRPRDNGVSVTVVLINRLAQPGKGFSDGFCWFRPSITIRAQRGQFVDRPSPRIHRPDEDEKSGDLLYRRVSHLAVGHACAAEWDDHTDGPEIIRSTFLPRHEVNASRADRSDVPDLGMRALSESDDLAPARELVGAYSRWISQQAARILDLSPAHEATAARHLDAARHAVARMEAGIQQIATDPDAGRAFRVMNGAMFAQRSRQVMIRGKLATPPAGEQYWRPFQMAFVLLNLEGLCDPSSAERDIADLLWFPTGGGKTEAYLGLIAFVVVLRRIRNAPGNGGGVAVIMRYTLRLLTIQQFERAAGLICALEEWRRRELPDAAPISIGLWVGQGATPNDVVSAARALNKWTPDADSDEGNPRQLLHCPWCGKDLPVSAYRADKVADRLTVHCQDVLCEFRSGIPVWLVDSDVYTQQPSLVIGTVDKFAMLAWKMEAGRLFGVDGSVDPPELIIQDELHLISGPLGTLVGLYETAVDAAATGLARPKLVASTATIKSARDQVRAVFARTSEQFPPPGIDAEDSFFAVAAPRHERGTREYVGVMSPGASHATLMIRVYAALLQAGKRLDVCDEVRDTYWTLLGYFNSLRVLGAAFIQTIDDVQDRIGVIADRTSSPQRKLSPPREMTSRKKSGEIPDELEIMGTAYPHPESPDTVLATNMISVGVDVDRLGMMAVMGQPQTTSEYIQASSRIGRQHPGLVVTLFNSARSRDLSHFENFLPYHRALYRQVEATGATPFAPRALDRGLHGVLVALTRLLVPNAAGERSVAEVSDSDAMEKVKHVLLARVRAVSPDTEADVEDAVDRLLEAWESAVAHNVDHYAGWNNRDTALLSPAGGSPGQAATAEDFQFPVEEPAWPTLTSLRNVDAESSLYLIRNRSSRDGKA